MPSRDTEAIVEAVQRPTMKFVATKAADQLVRCTASAIDWSVSVPASSIRSVRFLPERGIDSSNCQNFAYGTDATDYTLAVAC